MAEEKKKITAEDLLKQTREIDKLKAMGDENIFKKIEDAAESAADGDLQVLLDGISDIIAGGKDEEKKEEKKD